MLADTPGVKWVRDALDGRLSADHGQYLCGEQVKAPGTVRDQVEECEAGLGYLDEPLRDRLAAAGNRTRTMPELAAADAAAWSAVPSKATTRLTAQVISSGSRAAASTASRTSARSAFGS